MYVLQTECLLQERMEIRPESAFRRNTERPTYECFLVGKTCLTVCYGNGGLETGQYGLVRSVSDGVFRGHLFERVRFQNSC